MDESDCGIICGLAEECAVARQHLPSAMVRCAAARPQLAEQFAGELINAGAKHLISFGFAGGLSPELVTGSVIIATQIVDGETTVASNNSAISTALQIALPHGMPGKIWNSQTVIADVTTKERIYATTGCIATDMESGAVARVAHNHGVDFVAVRVVLDDAQTVLPPVAILPLTDTGNPNMAAILWSLLCRPSQLSLLPDLVRRHHIARVVLGQVALAISHT